VDHDITLQRARKSFGINDITLQWFQSYLLGRSPEKAGLENDGLEFDGLAMRV